MRIPRDKFRSKTLHSFGLVFAVFLFGGAGLLARPLGVEAQEMLREMDQTLRQQIAEIEETMVPSESFRAYEGEYFAALEPARPIPKPWGELQARLETQRLVLLSDTHSSPSSQGLGKKVLAEMRASGPVGLVLEWIAPRFQAEVDTFLAGKISLPALKEAIDFEDHWGFPFPGYGEILTYARDHGVPIQLVDPLRGLSLAERDQKIVAGTLRLSQKRPEARILVIYGTYHLLGKNHLSERFARSPLGQPLVLVDTAPKLFWRVFSKTPDLAKLGCMQLFPDVYFLSEQSPTERAWDYRDYLFRISGYEEEEFEVELWQTLDPPESIRPVLEASRRRP